MRTESILPSLIILFISANIFLLARAQSSSASLEGSTAALSQREGANRKSESSALDDSESTVEDDGSSTNYISTPDKRRIGSEFLGKRTIPSYYSFESEKRKALGSEFLGKRKLGSEFLGKRNSNNLPQQHNPEEYQFFYSNDQDDEPEYNINGKPELVSIPIMYPTESRFVIPNQQHSYYPPVSSFSQSLRGDDAWRGKLPFLKRGLGSEFLGKRDVYRPSAVNLINKWNRLFGPRLPVVEHDRKRKLMGSEFLG